MTRVFKQGNEQGGTRDPEDPWSLRAGLGLYVHNGASSPITREGVLMPAREREFGECIGWGREPVQHCIPVGFHGWTPATALKVGRAWPGSPKPGGLLFFSHPRPQNFPPSQFLTFQLGCSQWDCFVTQHFSDEQTHTHFTDGVDPLGWGHVAVVGVSLLRGAP